MATLYFTGDEVAFYTGISAQGQDTLFSGITAPFLPTDLVIVEVPDSDLGQQGEFKSSGVNFTSITVVRDGVSYDFDVAPEALVRSKGADGVEETGDTFFATATTVGPPDSGPFADLDAGQMVFSTTDTFTTGQDASIDRTVALDLNGDGDTTDVGEESNSLFNTSPLTDMPTDMPQASPPAPYAPCFAAGTMIATSEGDRRVEDLRPGDLVLSRDHGAQPVRWVRSWTQSLAGAPTEGRPVLVRAGALGPGLPAQDLIISPQHRLLAGGAGQLEGLWPTEALVPAKALTARAGIRHMKGRQSIVWVHFVCDRHEVIRANGCWSESLLLGPEAQQTLSQADLWALDAVLPPPVDPSYLNGAPARPCLRVGTVSRRIAAEVAGPGIAA